MQFTMKDNGQMRTQDVGLNYRDQNIKIVAPPIDGNTPVTLMHDINVVFIQFSMVITKYFLV